MQKFVLGLTALAFVAGSAPTTAAPCRDAKGKFTKCVKTSPKPARCRDSKGHYVKCGTPGAKPASFPLSSTETIVSPQMFSAANPLVWS